MFTNYKSLEKTKVMYRNTDNVSHAIKTWKKTDLYNG